MFRERWAHIFDRSLSWPIRLRWFLILPWSCRWNALVRDFTANLEGHASYDAEVTR